MSEAKGVGRASRPVATSVSSLVLFGGGSVVTSGGGLIAQMTGHVGTAALCGIYGSAGLIAVIGSLTAIVKILAERSPEIRMASGLVKIAKARTRQDGGKLLLLGKLLDKEGIATDQVLKVLDHSSASGGESRSTDESEVPSKRDETHQNVHSIYTRNKEGRALEAIL